MPVAIYKNVAGKRVLVKKVTGDEKIDADTVSSNKKETLPKYEPSEETPSASVVASSPSIPIPFIDKIAVVLTPELAEQALQIHSLLYQDMAGEKEFFVSAGKAAKGFNMVRLMVLPGYDERPRIDYAFKDKMRG
jgi:hypothetical protein